MVASKYRFAFDLNRKRTNQNIIIETLIKIATMLEAEVDSLIK